ncbi:MAG: mechanosensitive ion channel family protein [Saprospiraceae bacterium]
MEGYEKYITQFTDWAVVFVPRLFLAIIILFVGLWIVKKMSALVKLSLEKANISPEILTFLSSIIDIILKFVVLLIAAGVIGFEVSSLIGVFAAAGFAVGLALQGFLGNFASGITIVFFKPYKVGDWVEISEKFGKVESIQIFNTTIITPGEKTLIIPNGKVTDDIITNFSMRGHIRLELTVTMPYAESFPKIKSIILETLKDAPNILQDPAPQIGIEQYDSHNLNVAIRPFIKPDDYWDVTFDIYQRIKDAFHKHNIKVAYSEGIELGDIGD